MLNPTSTVHSTTCCSCPAANSRCATTSCPCYSTNQKCHKDCGLETPMVNGDFCPNRPSVTCRCERPDKSPTMVNEIAPNTATYQRYGDDFEEDDDRDHWSLKSADMSITENDLKDRDEQEPGLGEEKGHDKANKGAVSKRQACTSRHCDCFKFKERCTDECLCKGECTNNAAPKIVPFGERPQMSCKCKGGKSKSCQKDEKCPCRQLLNYCSKSCKCKSDCSNSTLNAARLSKNAKLCLISPDQPANFGLVRLRADNYDYQFGYCTADKFSAPIFDDKHVEEVIYQKIMAVLNHYQVPLRKIEIYVSKSPCYHQYCRPECGTLSTCDDNKCCSRTLAVMARQARRRLKNTTLEISVKILMVDGTRGDLYTTKSLSTMLKAGLQVEPLCMKEWGQFIFDKESQEPHAAEDFCSQAKNTWSVCQMDAYLLQTQQYVNKSRTSLGLKKSYWCSRLHELLKQSLRSTYESQRLFQDLESNLEKLTRRRHHFRSTMTLLSSLIGLGVNDRESSPPKNCNVASVEISPNLAQNRSSSKQKTSKKYVKRASSGPLIALSKQLSIFRNKSTSNTILNDENLVEKSENQPTNSTNTKIVRSSSYLHLKPTTMDENKPAIDIDRLILAVSSRNITEEEKNGMIKEISECVEDIKMRLDFFMDLLETKITSTSL